VIDTATHTIATNIPVVGDLRGIEISPDGLFAYVVISTGGAGVIVIDTSSNTVLTTVLFGGPGFGADVEFTPDGRFSYVAVQEGDLFVMETTSHSVVDVIDVDPIGPVGVAITPDGTLAYAINEGSHLDVIDIATNTVVSRVPVYGRTIAITPRIPRPSVRISQEMGRTFECDSIGQSTISAGADVFDESQDPVVELAWYVDGNAVGSTPAGEELAIDVLLGAHALRVDAMTLSGLVASDIQSVFVEDTIGPAISASLLETQKKGKNQVAVTIDVADVCDADPIYEATAGIPVRTGQEILVDKKTESLLLDSEVLHLRVNAADASGNTTSSQLELMAP
jgi:YVTN family beta-propeller protein